MAIDAISQDTNTARTNPPASVVAPSASDDDSQLSFWDMLDVINPLQNLPIIGNVYRAITGDMIKEGPRVMGGMLYGALTGPIGAVAGGAVALANIVVEEKTGRDVGGNMLAEVFGDDAIPPTAKSRTPTAIASADGAKDSAAKTDNAKAANGKEPISITPLAAPAESSHGKGAAKSAGRGATAARLQASGPLSAAAAAAQAKADTDETMRKARIAAGVPTPPASNGNQAIQMAAMNAAAKGPANAEPTTAGAPAANGKEAGKAAAPRNVIDAHSRSTPGSHVRRSTSQAVLGAMRRHDIASASVSAQQQQVAANAAAQPGAPRPANELSGATAASSAKAAAQPALKPTVHGAPLKPDATENRIAKDTAINNAYAPAVDPSTLPDVIMRNLSKYEAAKQAAPAPASVNVSG